MTSDPQAPAAEPFHPGSAPEAYRELAGLVLGEQSLSRAMSTIADLAARMVDGADEVSITLIREGRPTTIAFSSGSRLARVLDERQYADGFGPCLDAAVSGDTIAIDHSVTHDLYPDFSALAQREGVAATLAIGLPAVHRVTGAVNVYRYQRDDAGPSPFDAQSIALAEGFTGYASVALINAALYAGAVEEAAQMRQAMASRAVIEQAKGILMLQLHCDSETAFEVLRRRSMNANRKLHDVAAELVAAVTQGQTPVQPA